MPRPKKWRIVSSIPTIKVFGPLGTNVEETELVMMSVEEYESIRLMDLDGLDQNECAKKMMVARSTFQRIYTSAKKKMANCVVNGKVLKVEGGNYTLNICKMFCSNCGYEWEEKFEEIDENIKCPNCGTESNMTCRDSRKLDACRHCHRHRHRNGNGNGNGNGRLN
jgi:uncharacterized protein